jgi:hypothetical protein
VERGFGSSKVQNLSRKREKREMWGWRFLPTFGGERWPVLAMKGDKNSLHVFPRTSGPPDTWTQEPGTGPSRWNTPPHACDPFTLE